LHNKIVIEVWLAGKPLAASATPPRLLHCNDAHEPPSETSIYWKSKEKCVAGSKLLATHLSVQPLAAIAPRRTHGNSKKASA
jgi:hypothetical protein